MRWSVRNLGTVLKQRFHEPSKPVRKPVKKGKGNIILYPPKVIKNYYWFKTMAKEACLRALKNTNGAEEPKIFLGRPCKDILYFSQGHYLVTITDEMLSAVIEEGKLLKKMFAELPKVKEARSYTREGSRVGNEESMFKIMSPSTLVQDSLVDLYPTPWAMLTTYSPRQQGCSFAVALDTREVKDDLSIDPKNTIFVQHDFLTLFNKFYWHYHYRVLRLFPNQPDECQPILVYPDTSESFDPMGACMPISKGDMKPYQHFVALEKYYQEEGEE